MKIMTWNVNSLNVRLPHVLKWLEKHQPDVLGLQETKLTDDKFPLLEIKKAGYHAVYTGQKTYNGVAILSRYPFEKISFAPSAFFEEQKRIISATINGIRIINIYVPNGENVKSLKYLFKLNWLQQLSDYLKKELPQHSQLVVMGDFNIAPENQDVHDPTLWEGHVLFSQSERTMFQQLIALGLCDSFRLFPQPEKIYSWWDYRAGALHQNHGLRIDHILISEALAKNCQRVFIDNTPRKSERPSDHAPVIAEFLF